ncbi:hypothetical protein NE237_031045 [Protea cynaroides]|uniref:Uncharacterized protein n=1 Tax=Protea cynaroides TaxID=273540 RepID=A0A9Q0JXV8_9MAGN|nr:hypothetical protein NE237_031045 [Protea cynaroides]
MATETTTTLINKPAGSIPRRVCFSFAAYAKNVINHLKKCQIPIDDGPSDDEFSSIESTFGFSFPPDLRSILCEGLSPLLHSFTPESRWKSYPIRQGVDFHYSGYDVARFFQNVEFLQKISILRPSDTSESSRMEAPLWPPKLQGRLNSGLIWWTVAHSQ